MSSMNQSVVLLRKTVNYTDTAGKVVFTLPTGAIPLLCIVQVKTAFNDSGTDTLSIGTSASNTLYASGVNVSTTGGKLVALSNNEVTTKKTGVFVKYTGENSDATAGLAEILLLCSNPF
jgi:hypothetical protein